MNNNDKNKEINKISKSIAASFNKEKLFKATKLIHESINNLLSTFNEQFKNFYDSIPNDEQMQSTITKYKKWAKYGWILSYGDININTLKTDISNEDEANKEVLSKYTKELQKELFHSLNHLTNHQYMLENSINAYLHKNYIGCVLIVCSIIDRILSENFQSSVSIRRKKATGKSGTKALYYKYSNNQSQYGFLEIYLLEALKIVLENFFHDAEDFTFESKGIINRNLISHGWYDKIVTEIDCLKFFHLLGALQTVIFYKLYE